MLEEERRSRVRVERIGEGEEDWAVGWENGGGKAEAQERKRRKGGGGRERGALTAGPCPRHAWQHARHGTQKPHDAGARPRPSPTGTWHAR